MDLTSSPLAVLKPARGGVCRNSYCYCYFGGELAEKNIKDDIEYMGYFIMNYTSFSIHIYIVIIELLPHIYCYCYYYYYFVESFHPIQELRRSFRYIHMALMFLRSRSHVKASMVLMRAGLFIHNYIRSFLNIILRPILMVRTGLKPVSYCLCV